MPLASTGQNLPSLSVKNAPADSAISKEEPTPVNMAKSALKFDNIRPKDNLGQSEPYRPIQYLGSKVRVIDAICGATNALVGPGGRVADLFAGSTVVSQALAQQGYSVTSVDSQRYSQTLGAACLSVNRAVGEKCYADDVLDFVLPQELESVCANWNVFAESEASALRSKSAEGLRHVHAELPLVWRENANFHQASIRDGKYCLGFGELALITSIYAGSYFGVAQSLAIDRIRLKIHVLRGKKLLSKWQESAMMTALLSAASAAVHSAGKHFAQPLNAGMSTNRAFNDKRLLQDRNISIEAAFSKSCDALNNLPFDSAIRNSSLISTAEAFVETRAHGYDLLYLDPPYTAQQYSRFYHILETICSYEVPQLYHDGAITSGLYPVERFKSDFCSKTKALPAMSRLIEGAKRSGTNLLISYSLSDAGSVGNARMMSLDQLLEACKASYGSSSVEWWSMGHTYRQFNKASNANIQRSDPEILIACKTA